MKAANEASRRLVKGSVNQPTKKAILMDDL